MCTRFQFASVFAVAILLGATGVPAFGQFTDPGFAVWAWDKTPDENNALQFNIDYIQNPANTPLPGSPFLGDQFIEYWDSGGTGVFDDNLETPLLPNPQGANDSYIIRATAWLFFPSAGPFTLAVNSDDGFRVAVDFNRDGQFPDGSVRDGEVVGFFDGGRGAATTTFSVTVPGPGFWFTETVYWDGCCGSSAEFFQVLDNGDQVLINDPDDMRSLRAVQTPDFETTQVAFVPADPISASVGDSNRVLAVVVPSDGSGAAGQDVTVTVTSSNAGVADVVGGTLAFTAGGDQFQSFEVDFIAPGSTTLTLSNDAGIPVGPSVSVDVTDLQGISLELTSVVVIGNAVQASVEGDFGPVGVRDLTNDPDTSFLSDNPDIVTVSDSGVVTAVGLGVANVTAMHGSFSDTGSILVVEAVAAGASGFQVEIWENLFVGHNTDNLQSQVFGVVPPTCVVSEETIDFQDTGGGHCRFASRPVPCLPPPDNDDWIIRATGFIHITSTDPVQFGMCHDDAVLLRIDGLEIFQSNSWDNGMLAPVPLWTPPRTGFLPIEFFMEEQGGGSYIELTQDVGGGEHVLVNDPDDPRSFRVFSQGCPEDVTGAVFVRDEPVNLTALEVGTRLQVSVAIDQPRDGTVTITSDNPSVLGDSVVQFAGFADLSCIGTFIDVVGTGTARLSLSNDMGLPNGPDLVVNVNEPQALTVDLLAAGMGVGDEQQATVRIDFAGAGTQDRTDPATGTIYDTSDANVLTVDENGVVTAVGEGVADVIARNSGLEGRFSVVVGDVTRIAILAGRLDLGPNPGDRTVADLLGGLQFDSNNRVVDANGDPAFIAFFSDTDFDPRDISDRFDLLIISSTVSSINVSGKFNCLNIPIVFWESALNQPGRLALSGEFATRNPAPDPMNPGQGELADCQQGIFVLPGMSHPITQGLDTDVCVDVFTEPEAQNVALGPPVLDAQIASGALVLAENEFLGDGTIVVAGPPGDPDIPGGDGLRVGGGGFLSRHVFLLLNDTSAQNLNETGRDILTRSVDWALAGERAPFDITELVLTVPPAIAVGAPRQVRVEGLAQFDCVPNLTDAGTGTTYESSDTNVATIDENGLLTGIAQGVVEVTASNGGLSTSAMVLVAEALAFGESGFNIETWGPGVGTDVSLQQNVDWARNNPPNGITASPTINFADFVSDAPAEWGDIVDPNGEPNFPFLPPVPPNDNNDFIFRGTGFLLVESLTPVELRVHSDDGFQLIIDGAVIDAFDGGRAPAASTFTFAPTRTGFLPMELIMWEEGGDAEVELTQIVAGNPVLVNDPDNTQTLRAFTSVCPPTEAVVAHSSSDAILLTAADLPASVQVDVTIPEVRDGRVTLTSTDPSVAGGDTILFAAFTGFPCGAALIDVVAPGTTMLELSNDMGFGNGPAREITVIAIDGISMSVPFADTMVVGSRRQATVTGTFGVLGAQDITAGATGTVYTSNAEDIATVSADGLITGVGVGTADITAANGGLSETVTVTVGSAFTGSGFLVKVWDQNPIGGNTDGLQTFADTVAETCEDLFEVINFQDTGGDHEAVGNNNNFPCLPPPGDNDNFIVEATGFIDIPSLEPITFGLIHDDAVLLEIGGEEVFQSNSWDGGNFQVADPWTPPATGVLPIRILMEERGGGAYLELTQDVGGGEFVLVNDPSDTRTLRVSQEGVVAGPALVNIVDGLGATPDSFISSRGEDCGFTEFSLQANEPLVLNGVTATYTAAGAPPDVALADNGGGQHTVTLSERLSAGHRLTLELDVTGQTSGLSGVLTISVAHLPLDINQDGVVNVRDATEFGVEFRGRRDPRLIDINCDGIVDIRDATAFGGNWRGDPPATREWRAASLP